MYAYWEMVKNDDTRYKDACIHRVLNCNKRTFLNLIKKKEWNPLNLDRKQMRWSKRCVFSSLWIQQIEK